MVTVGLKYLVSILNTLYEIEIRKILKYHLRKIVSRIFKEQNIKTSIKIVRNYLNSIDRFAFPPIKKLLLTKRHIEPRKVICEKIIKLSEEKAKTIIFIDESKFNLIYSNDKVLV